MGEGAGMVEVPALFRCFSWVASVWVFALATLVISVLLYLLVSTIVFYIYSM